MSLRLCCCDCNRIYNRICIAIALRALSVIYLHHFLLNSSSCYFRYYLRQSRRFFEFREELGVKASQLVYDGRWFTPLCQSILAASNELAQDVSGEVVIKLYKGQVTVTQKRSNNSLYSEEFATFGADDVYDQSHAEGFIRLYSLSSRIRALKNQN